MDKFISRLQEHPRALRLFLVILAVCLFALFIFVLVTRYEKATEHDVQVYDKRRELETLAEPEKLEKVGSTDPELQAKAQIEDRYLLFEHMDFEQVEYVQDQLDDLINFYETLAAGEVDSTYYEDEMEQVLRYAGALDEIEFSDLITRMRGREVEFTMLDSFRHLESASLILFDLESADPEMTLKCVFNKRQMTFVAKLQIEKEER